MAFASVGTLGATSSGTANQSSIALTTTAAAEAANLVVVVVSCDNNQTTDGDEGAVSSITDSAGGNTWTKGLEFTNGQGTAQTGATVSVWFSKLTNQINNGGTITANLTNNTSRDAVCISAWEFTVSGTVSVDVTNTVANDGALDPTSLDATTSNAERLRIRACGVETRDSAFTPTTSWTGFTATSIDNGSDPVSMALMAEFIISTGTGAASTLNRTTGGNRDWASVYVTLQEIASGQPTIRRHGGIQYGITQQFSRDRGQVWAPSMRLITARRDLILPPHFKKAA